MTCRNGACAAEFESCSGELLAPGSTSCNALLFQGAKGAGWQLGVITDAFVTAAGAQAYKDLGGCACSLIGPAGCQAACDDAFTNGPPNFCNGALADSKCLTCLETTCGSSFDECSAN